jgi:hypothetical protein
MCLTCQGMTSSQTGAYRSQNSVSSRCRLQARALQTHVCINAEHKDGTTRCPDTAAAASARAALLGIVRMQNCLHTMIVHLHLVFAAQAYIPASGWWGDRGHQVCGQQHTAGGVLRCAGLTDFVPNLGQIALH